MNKKIFRRLVLACALIFVADHTKGLSPDDSYWLRDAGPIWRVENDFLFVKNRQNGTELSRRCRDFGETKTIDFSQLKSVDPRLPDLVARRSGPYVVQDTGNGSYGLNRFGGVLWYYGTRAVCAIPVDHIDEKVQENEDGYECQISESWIEFFDRDGKLLLKIRGVPSWFISPVGDSILLGDIGGAKLWTKGRETWDIPFEIQNAIFSEDGRYVILLPPEENPIYRNAIAPKVGSYSVLLPPKGEAPVLIDAFERKIIKYLPEDLRDQLSGENAVIAADAKSMILLDRYSGIPEGRLNLE